MARRRDLEKAAVELARMLGPDDCLLVGGMAVGAYGYVRATKDVDFVVDVPLETARTRLGHHGISSSLERGDPAEGDFSCVKGSLHGVPFDVMPPLVRLDWSRSVTLPMTKRTMIRVVDLDGLIRLKVRAGGPRDLLDVAALVLLYPEHRAAARELAVAYRAADKLEIWLNDPRLKAEVLESRPKS
jgi:hypothetical protein